MALLFGSLPIASRLFLGVWGFDGAAGVSCLCLILGTYFHIRSRRNFVLPDSAMMLDRAIRLAMSGRTGDADALLTETIRLSPQLWQAFQYRGELRLTQGNSADAALQDFTEAIRLAPGEPHLYLLRAQAHSLLGDDLSCQRDNSYAASLAGRVHPGAPCARENARENPESDSSGSSGV